MAKDIQKKTPPWAWIVIIILIISSAYYFILSITPQFSGLGRLKEDYEVLSYSCGADIVHLEMKSLGSRSDQVYEGIIYLFADCPGSNKYFLSVIEPTKSCIYGFDGEIIKFYRSESKFLSKESEKIINESLDFKLWEGEARLSYSDPNKKGSQLSFDYEHYLENGITKTTIRSIIDNEINDRSSCE